MPALRAFGRRWNLGSDDLVYPILLEVVMRTSWLLALLVVYFLEVDQYDCKNGDIIKYFYLGTMAFLTVYLVINTAIATISTRSYIMEPYPRRHVTSLLYVKLAVFIPEVGWAVLGTMWTFWLDHDCSVIAMALAKSAVIIEWLIIVCILGTIYVMFDPMGTRNVKQRSLRDYHQFWHGRCRAMCCCLRQDENRGDAFEEVAHLLTKFFQGRDFVLTDVMSGIILLSVKQRYERVMNPKPTASISQMSTLQIRSCQRSEYHYTHSPYGSQRSTSTISSGDHVPFKANPLEHPGPSINYDPRSGSFLDNDKRRSWGENSVNAGQSDVFYVESEETKLHDAKKKVPDYGSSSSEDKESVVSAQTSVTSNGEPDTSSSKGPPDKLRRQMAAQASVASSMSSWSSMSSDSVSCLGVAPPVGPKPWMTLENAAHYLRYACASYGSSNYGGCYNCGDRIPLCRKYRWFENDPYLPPEVLQGDNYWECEASSIMLYSNIDRDNIIYANLDNQIFKTPYFICRDDIKKEVVIAIRGTMSAGDALTDLTAHGQDIEVEHLPRGNVHRGILKVARAMRDQLNDEICLKNKIPKGYKLVVSGHSLGAGVAAILSLLIRDQFPDITCYAFSPPGGLVSLPLSMHLQDFVLTCFLGMDVVVRLSVTNMENLKADLLAIIKNSRLPKYKILTTGLQSMCCGCVEADDTLLLEDTQTTKLSLNKLHSISLNWENIDIDDRDVLVAMDDTRATDLSRQSSAMTTREDSITDDVMRPRDAQRVSSMRSISTASTRSTVSSIAGEMYRGKHRESTSSRDSEYSQYSQYSQSGHTSGIRKVRKERHHHRHLVEKLSNSHAKWRHKQKKKKVGLAAMDPLYLPGQILYLYEDEELLEEGCCSSQPMYKARWAHPEEFDTIPLHSKMMYHHNPYTIDEALQQILKQGLYTPQLGLTGVVSHQPGHYASPYNYDYSPEGSLRRGSDDSGIPESIRKTSRDSREAMKGQCSVDMGEYNPAFEDSGSEAEPKTVDYQSIERTTAAPLPGQLNSAQTQVQTCVDEPAEVLVDPMEGHFSANKHDSGFPSLDSSHITDIASLSTVTETGSCREFNVDDQAQFFQILETNTVEMFVSSPSIFREYVGSTAATERYVLGSGEEENAGDPQNVRRHSRTVDSGYSEDGIMVVELSGDSVDDKFDKHQGDVQDITDRAIRGELSHENVSLPDDGQLEVNYPCDTVEKSDRTDTRSDSQDTSFNCDTTSGQDMSNSQPCSGTQSAEPCVGEEAQGTGDDVPQEGQGYTPKLKDPEDELVYFTI